MKYLLLLLAAGCVDDSTLPPDARQPPPEPSASAAPQDDKFEVINQRKFDAIRHCEAGGGIVAMGFGWRVVCIEGQVKSYDAETENVTSSSTYDYTR